MTEAAPSYAHGTSTVAADRRDDRRHFDRTVARWGDRPALIVRQQGIRWTYRELGEQVDAFAAGLLALGLKPGERVGIWSPNNAEWVVTQFATAKAGLILVNINPAYRLAELEYALNKVGLPRADHRDRVQDQRLYRHDQHAGAGAARRASRATCDAAKLPTLRMVIQIGGRPRPGMLAFDERLAIGRRRRARAPGGTGRHAAVRRPDQHPVHLGHHRRAEGRDADAPQHPQQRLSSSARRCATPSRTRSASRCRCITASAW